MDTRLTAEDRIHLALQWRSGSVLAPNELVAYLRPKAIAFLVKRALQPADAEDVAQESCIDFFSQIDHYDSAHPPESLFGVIVAREYAKFLQSRHKLPVTGMDRTPEPLITSPEPDQPRSFEELLLQLVPTLSLSDWEQEGVLLRFLKGLTYKEIRDIVGYEKSRVGQLFKRDLPLNVAKSLVAQEEFARELLRHAWLLKDDNGQILYAWELVEVMVASLRTKGTTSGFRGSAAELFGETLCLAARLNLDQHRTGKARKLLIEADTLPNAGRSTDRFGQLIQGIRAHSFTAEYAFDRAVEEYRKISGPHTDPLLVRNIGMAHRGAGCLDEARAKLRESLHAWQSVSVR